MLINTNPHGRFVDTHEHEAPAYLREQEDVSPTDPAVLQEQAEYTALGLIFVIALACPLSLWLYFTIFG